MGTVETQALRDAATGFTTYGQKFHDTVVPALDRAPIPSEDFPLLNMGFEAQYKRSWEEMNRTCRTIGDSIKTIGLALTLVANHYQGQDAENAKMFHGKPIDPPKVAPAQSMGDSVHGWEIPVEAVVDGLAATALVGAVAMLAAAGAPLLLTVPVLAVGGFCYLNIVDPAPYFVAAGAWGDIEQVVSDAATRLPKLVTEVTSKAQWTGDGATAFSDYVTNELTPVLNALVSLAGDLKQMCIQTAWVLIVSLVSFLGATVAAAELFVAADAAEATVVGAPAAEAGAIAGFGVWAGFCGGLIMEIGSTCGDNAVASSTVESGLRQLDSALKDNNDRIEYNALALTPTATTQVQDWKAWQNSKVPA